ncbi:hypothetical protein FRC0524_02039 [Corynebacterium diphtheriae]|nr:hypothetical protein FRC0524_02039 [Corynebacterium diphtheriae]
MSCRELGRGGGVCFRAPPEFQNRPLSGRPTPGGWGPPPSRFLACSLRVRLAEKNTVKSSTEHKRSIRIGGEIGACANDGAWLEAEIYFWNTQILLITGCTFDVV